METAACGRSCRGVIGAVALLGLLFVGVGFGPAGSEASTRPNIVVVMTDDQEVDTTAAQFMPQLQSLIAQQGLTFDNSFVNYSFCCPSRVTYFTGQYAHNHGVLTNVPPQGGYPKFKPTIGNSLPVWLKNAGYYTGLMGELVNGYQESAVPPGWSEFFGTYGQGAFDYLVNDNGNTVQYGHAPADYETDVLSSKAADFIHRRAPKTKPFYLHVAGFSPHTEGTDPNNNPRAAPRHEGAFADEPLPKPPSYNESNVSDKPEQIRDMPPIPPIPLIPPVPPTGEGAIRKLHQDRLEALLAVDDLIGNVVNALQAEGELDDTVIVFTSDNGLLKGEHRIRPGKVYPYEPSIRVPLFVRGPGVPSGQQRSQHVANVDLAPTILDLANATPGRAQDGRSLLPLFANAALPFDRAIMLEGDYNKFGEFGPGPRIVFKGVRTERYMYALWETGEEELYDLQNDPNELQSRHNDPSYVLVKSSLEELLAKLKSCAGTACQTDLSPVHCNGGTIGQDDQDDVLEGTPGADLIHGLGGNDVTRGKAGPDCLSGDMNADELRGGGDSDQLWGGAGSDEFFAVGGGRDTIHCGTGTDRVHADRDDSLSSGCEHVTRGS